VRRSVKQRRPSTNWRVDCVQVATIATTSSGKIARAEKGFAVNAIPMRAGVVCGKTTNPAIMLIGRAHLKRLRRNEFTLRHLPSVTDFAARALVFRPSHDD
jgi:hypothetical protein